MFRSNRWRSLPLNTRLLSFMIGLLLLSCLVVGIPSYFIAKAALNTKGETILKNGVEMALLLIESKSEEVASGNITLAEAQEQVKISLSGVKRSDGTREINHNVDLGQNGYFIVYSLDGIELMHPTLEGQNVWSVVSKGGRVMYPVQEQIYKATHGGGFTVYTWNYPNSEKLGQKITYSKVDPNWNWVVIAGAYMSDHNAAAYTIMKIMIMASAVLLTMGAATSSLFVRGITKPLSQVVAGMKRAERGNYQSIGALAQKDEMGMLVSGFNNMVTAIDSAQRDLISQEERIRHYAYFDQLSGLPNSNKFKEHVSRRMAQDIKKGYLVLMDIKDFKAINSVYGSIYGDTIIHMIGEVLSREELRPLDESMVARFNGNEFAAWLENWTMAHLEEALANYKALLQKTLKENGMEAHLDFYLSVSEYAIDGRDFDTCYQKATIALQHAKESGETALRKYEPELFEILEREETVKALAETALEEDEFVLYYQNKVDLIENKIVGVEALARWHSHTLGPVSPAVFIPAISKANLMTEFSTYVFKKALDDFPKLQAKFHEDLTLSVNISPIFFLKQHFVSFVLSEIEARNINPSQVILEITEDTFISEFELIQSKVKELRAGGVRISLDDFGTGYSSLNYLTSIHFDEIKIDKAFIDFLSHDHRALALLKNIVEVARIFDYKVVAEGVETSEQVEKLASVGCYMIQGYLYSKPEPLT